VYFDARKDAPQRMFAIIAKRNPGFKFRAEVNPTPDRRTAALPMAIGLTFKMLFMCSPSFKEAM